MAPSVAAERRLHVRRLALVGVIAAAGLTVALTTAFSEALPERQAVPRAECGPGSNPESDIQGRVPKAEFDSGRYLQGYTCNTELVSHEGVSGGFKTLKYTDSQGRTCAYYDSTTLVDGFTNVLTGKGAGVVVLDMTDPAKPVKTTNLTTAAMLSPHESLLVNEKRGLLVGIMGTPVTAPGALDVYDVRTDCRYPKLLSSSLAGILGHESGFAPDGKTLYVSSSGLSLVAVDLTDPRKPRPLTVQVNVQYHGMRLSDDGRTMYAANIGEPLNGGLVGGANLTILDVSEVQDRKLFPQAKVLSKLTWHGSATPQVAEPFTRDGHQYVLEVDEFIDFLTFKGLADFKNAAVGAARIINVDDPRHPFEVSDIRLEVHQPENRTGPQTGDPGATSPLGGYAAHYCSMPTRDNPDIAGCSMIASGLRLFDIRDVENPKEVAYYNLPSSGGGNAMAQPAWDIANDTVWFTDSSTGFNAVRLTNGVQKLLPKR